MASAVSCLLCQKLLVKSNMPEEKTIELSTPVLHLSLSYFLWEFFRQCSRNRRLATKFKFKIFHLFDIFVWQNQLFCRLIADSVNRSFNIED